MVLSKEHQEVMVHKYLKTHTVSETEAFMEGMMGALDAALGGKK